MEIQDEILSVDLPDESIKKKYFTSARVLLDSLGVDNATSDKGVSLSTTSYSSSSTNNQSNGGHEVVNQSSLNCIENQSSNSSSNLTGIQSSSSSSNLTGIQSSCLSSNLTEIQSSTVDNSSSIDRGIVNASAVMNNLEFMTEIQIPRRRFSLNVNLSIDHTTAINLKSIECVMLKVKEACLKAYHAVLEPGESIIRRMFRIEELSLPSNKEFDNIIPSTIANIESYCTGNLDLINIFAKDYKATIESAKMEIKSDHIRRLNNSIAFLNGTLTNVETSLENAVNSLMEDVFDAATEKEKDDLNTEVKNTIHTFFTKPQSEYITAFKLKCMNDMSAVVCSNIHDEPVELNNQSLSRVQVSENLQDASAISLNDELPHPCTSKVNVEKSRKPVKDNLGCQLLAGSSGNSNHQNRIKPTTSINTKKRSSTTSLELNESNKSNVQTSASKKRLFIPSQAKASSSSNNFQSSNNSQKANTFRNNYQPGRKNGPPGSGVSTYKYQPKPKNGPGVAF